MSYTTLQTQMAAELVKSRKIHALREHARLADNANYDRRLLVQTNGYSTSDNEEAAAYAHATNYLDRTLVPALEDQFRRLRSTIQDPTGFFGVLAAEISAKAEDIAIGAIEYEYLDTDGAITITSRKGLLGALRRQMELDGEYVTPNVVTPGSLTAKAGNVGSLTGTTLTFEGHCPSGTFTFKCVDESVSAPKFEVSLKLVTGSKLADGVPTLEADNRLQPEKAFSDGPTGCSAMVLTRSGLASPTESGDGHALFSSTSFTTPKTGDCTAGRFFVTVTRLAGNAWDIVFYKDSALTEVVGRGLDNATSAAPTGTSSTSTCTAVLANGTIVAFTFSKANAHSNLANVGDDDTDIYFDIATPRLGDEWTLAVTNDYAGNFATKILHLWRVSLPTTGSNLWTNSLAASVAVT